MVPPRWLRHLVQARQMVRTLLVRRITFTPTPTAAGERYAFSAQCSIGQLPSSTLALEKHPQRWWPQRDSNPCFSLERAVS